MNTIIFDRPFAEDKENYLTKLKAFRQEHDVKDHWEDITGSTQRYAAGITHIMGSMAVIEVYHTHSTFSKHQQHIVKSIITLYSQHYGSYGCVLGKSFHNSMEDALREFCQETAKLVIQCNPPHRFHDKFTWDEDDLPEVKNPAKRHPVKRGES